jgi:hypothetical protein
MLCTAGPGRKVQEVKVQLAPAGKMCAQSSFRLCSETLTKQHGCDQAVRNPEATQLPQVPYCASHIQHNIRCAARPCAIPNITEVPAKHHHIPDLLNVLIPADAGCLGPTHPCHEAPAGAPCCLVPAAVCCIASAACCLAACRLRLTRSLLHAVTGCLMHVHSLVLAVLTTPAYHECW